jgi:UDPglucose--hexose-1-phosphate uridylyltransferase
MPDFQFIEDHYNRRISILAPRRSHRPDNAKGTVPVCPFCVGIEQKEKELYRIGGVKGDPHWRVLVVPNLFPFAPHHEVIIHSQNHTDSFRSLPFEHVENIIAVYRDRYNFHMEHKHGQVYIFHNHREAAGESLRHPHSQLVVIPFGTHLDTPVLRIPEQDTFEVDHFLLFCPITSQWPDEVWIAPKKNGKRFGEITDEEMAHFAGILQRLVHIMALRHGNMFPYNFYIYPGTDWYLRLIPRSKILGGFELGTNIYVNTQDPKETIAFIKEHFYLPNEEKIKTIHKATYKKSV